MDNFDLNLAASWCCGEFTGCNAKIQRVSIDSRQVQPHDLYVALKGERFDGHEFVAKAFASGAAGAVVKNDFIFEFEDEKFNKQLIRVDDTRKALGSIAKAWRDLFELKVIAITGSNGKTTVKEMLTEILKQHAGEDVVLSTEGNFNNDIGLPLTLLKINSKHKYAVVEMGMNHAREIEYLTKLAKPDLALINNVSLAHVGGGFSSLKDIAKAKAEIFSGLKNAGIALINADDENCDLLTEEATKHTKTIRKFGTSESCDVYASRFEFRKGSVKFSLFKSPSNISVILNLMGMHNIFNAVAAAALAVELGVPFSQIRLGLQSFAGVASRMQTKKAKCGAEIIDDTYNANPSSIIAALDVLAMYSAPRVFVMGDMGELGDFALKLHREVIEYAYSLGIENIFTLGELSKQAAIVSSLANKVQSFSNIDDLLKSIDSILKKDSTLLIKGSRLMRMERVVQYLIEPNDI